MRVRDFNFSVILKILNNPVQTAGKKAEKIMGRTHGIC